MKDQPDYTQPVAYDPEGRPLYAHPPAATPQSTPHNLVSHPSQNSHVTSAPLRAHGNNFDPRTRVQYANEPDARHVERPFEPAEIPISDEVKSKSEASKRQYPFLNISEGEYVILDVRRHPIGLFIHLVVTFSILFLVLGIAAVYPGILAQTAAAMNVPTAGDVWFVAILVAILVMIFGYISVWVYMQNKFFMTNESVIQEIQHSLFSKHEQTVSLGSIEDASFKHANIIQSILDYGTIRLSTEGEETTYRFHFVSNPKKQIAILNNAVESFKNGRPVED
jgi:uncharacterized membrane protein (DUF485 family)